MLYHTLWYIESHPEIPFQFFLLTDPLVEEILSIDGGYMFASAIATGLLAQGVDPVRVSGYTAAGFVPVLYKMFEIIDLEHLWGVPALAVAMGAVVVTACIVVGTLH